MDSPILQKSKFSIYEVLELVRKHPQMYLGEHSIVRLRSFLVGYECALGSQGFSFRDERPVFFNFHDWVAKRLGFSESTSGWCNMILQKSANEREALERFYLLLDEFRKTQV